MFTFIITLIIIAALLLVLVVLAQNSKGGGLSSQFGGSGTSQIMGVKRTGDLLERLTWGLAISVLALSLGSYIFLKEQAKTPQFTSPIIERAQQQTILPPAGSTSPLEGIPLDSDGDFPDEYMDDDE